MFGEQRKELKHKSVEWYTPAWIFQSLGVSFETDPCSPHDAKSFVPAAVKYTVFDDGLSKSWEGRVWLNPPYGRKTGIWLDRLIAHGNGIALVFSRTDAAWFQRAMRQADAFLLMAGRIDFVPGIENEYKRGRSGAGTAMFAFGQDNAEALWNLQHRGVFFFAHDVAWGKNEHRDLNRPDNRIAA